VAPQKEPEKFSGFSFFLSAPLNDRSDSIGLNNRTLSGAEGYIIEAFSQVP
jgi:hypothetical protein